MEFSKLKKKLRIFANLQFAIFVLLAIALCGAIGSMIEQDQPATFYSEIYPKGKLFFGFINCETILYLGLDHIYQTPWFIFLLGLLAISLTNCTKL